MSSLAYGMHHLKKRITINAPAAICYQAWLDSPQLTQVMRRVLRFEYKAEAIVATNSIEEVLSHLSKQDQDILPLTQIKQWLFAGPGGKVYKIESTTILEIPNRFYCATSNDPNDLSIQSSLLFSPDEADQNTLLEWQISFWVSEHVGEMTQLVADIQTTNDSFLEDCLQDFKTYVENIENK